MRTLEIEDVLLLELRQDGNQRIGPLAAGEDVLRALAVLAELLDTAGGEKSVRALVVVDGEPDLLQVVHALRPPRRLASRLHGGEEQRDQAADDREDYKQLDERERPTPVSSHGLLLPRVLAELERRFPMAARSATPAFPSGPSGAHPASVGCMTHWQGRASGAGNVAVI